MYATTQLNGQDAAFPDVCLTPTPAPTPLPYPNVAIANMAVGFCPKVLLVGAPAHTLSTTIPMTNGDNAGVNMGQRSGTVMASSRHINGSKKVLWGGIPATRLTSKTKQNTVNADGVRITPSQTKVLLCS